MKVAVSAAAVVVMVPLLARAAMPCRVLVVENRKGMILLVRMRAIRDRVLASRKLRYVSL